MTTSNKKCLNFIVTRFFAIVLLAFCALPLQPRLRAQENPAAGSDTCASSELIALISREGSSVRVNAPPTMQPATAGSSENEKGIAAAQNPEKAETLRQAYRWFEKGARKGYAPAEVNLAVASIAGWGTQPNPGAALYWLKQASDKGYALAYFDLGIFYMHGCGVKQDYTEALHYFEQGANAGDSAAQTNLGYLYDKGLGVPQNRVEAAECYTKAAERGEARAQYNLADLYAQGEGVQRDETIAFGWFQKAALQGHSGARVMLGTMYAAGRGTEKDKQTAYQWLTAASLQGDTRGAKTLETLQRQLNEKQIAEAKERAQSLMQAEQSQREAALLH